MNDQSPSVPTEEVVDMSPFKRLVMTIGTLPTAFTESLTYYEALAYFVKYLEETVIPAINQNAAATRELQILFTELKNYVDTYFDNLDVQEEINNKLDDMVEAGTLQEIIAEYLNSRAIFAFDSVSDMVSATNLIDGSYARTLGYHAKNDGGGALYKIRTIINDDVVDNMFIIEMDDDTLIGELICENVNIKQLGAVENADITDIVEASLDKLGYANLSSGTYKCNISVTDDVYTKIQGDGCVLKPNNSDYPVIDINCTDITTDKIINGIKLELTGSENGIKIAKHFETQRLYHPQRVNLSNITANVTTSFTGKVIDLQYLSELNIDHIYVKRTDNGSTYTGTGIAISSCVNINITDSSFGYINKGIDIYTNNKSCEGINISNVEFLFNNYGVYAQSTTSYNVLSVRVTDCMVDQIQVAGVVYDGIMASSITNCWFGANGTNADAILLQATNLQLYQTVIENNMIWLNNQTGSYCIRISRSASYNINGVNISNNTIYNYRQKAIYLDNANSISNLNITNNNFATTSSDATNTPLSYNAVPTNCYVTNCNNGGSPLITTDNIVVKNCVGILNYKLFSSDDITIGETLQNNSNNVLNICVTATASGSTGYVSASVGRSQATMTSRYTQSMGSGIQGVLYITVPPKGYYNIQKTSAITVNSIYGYYEY